MGPRGVERGLEISKVGYPQITPTKQERYLRERSDESSSHVNRLVIACFTYSQKYS